jgi:hypothetical protein
MITHPLVTDLYRIVEGEAQSALPNAPVRPDRVRAPRVSLLASTRLRLTAALRWAADVLEPSPAQREHFATPERGGC